MSIINTIKRKIQEVGIKNVLIGALKRVKYERLQKKYNFDAWHLSPYEWREYIQKTAEYINSNGAVKVIDIGCGLGGLLRHVDAKVKIGLDVSLKTISAASSLHEKGGDGIVFKQGSFNDVVDEGDIDYVITLGFMHGGTEKTWKEPYHLIAEQNNIKNFIVDVVPAVGDSHCLDFEKILPSNYKKIEKLGPFLSGRYVEVWRKTEV